MGKIDEYRERLRELEDWDAFLLAECGLPGPRGNLELARAVAHEGDQETFERFLSFDPQTAPTNSPQEFLAFCGALGLGKLLVEGKREAMERLRVAASDPRWRSREAVAMALQRFGAADMDALLSEMEVWSRGSLLEQRAAAAALCEPSLLQDPGHAEQVLRILNEITTSVPLAEDRKQEDFRALRKGLGYCWSVATAAHPAAGKAMMETWFRNDDPDVRWIMKENLRKKRLERMDESWVATWRARLRRR